MLSEDDDRDSLKYIIDRIRPSLLQRFDSKNLSLHNTDNFTMPKIINYYEIRPYQIDDIEYPLNDEELRVMQEVKQGYSECIPTTIWYGPYQHIESKRIFLIGTN